MLARAGSTTSLIYICNDRNTGQSIPTRISRCFKTSGNAANVIERFKKRSALVAPSFPP